MSDTNRHDALFRRMFGDPKTAATLIRSHLPPDIGAAIDWPTLKLAPSEFVSDALKDQRNDLLFTVDLEGQPAFVYLLLEHQSRADPMMPFRVLRYIVHVWSRWLEKDKTARTLPPVIPIVIHHDRTPWAAPTRLSEIIEAPDDLCEVLAPFLPELALSIDELTGITDEELAQRALDVFANLTIRALTRIRFGGDVLAEFERWLPLLRVMWNEPNGLPRLRALLQYLGWHTDEPPAEVAKVIEQIGPGAVEDYMRSTNQQIMDQGEAKGLEKGLAEGEAKMLLRQLELRFGPLDDATRDRVHAGSAEDRARWIERVLTAHTLTDVFTAC